MRAPRALAALFLAALLALSACGGDDPDGGDAEPTSEPTTEPAGDDPPVEEPDDTDDSGEESPAGDICAEVSAADVSTALATPGLTVEEVPGGGCNFYSEEDPRAPSAVLNVNALIEGAGGFEGTKSGATALIDGEVETLDGIGDDAFILVGGIAGSDNPTGSGAVLVGSAVVQITVIQAAGLSADDVRQKTIAVLTLVADKS